MRLEVTRKELTVPDSLYGDKGVLPLGANATEVHVGQWLADTPVYLDAFEIIAEKARRFWWGQQAELATISWSLLLSIEGRRRNVPHLWAYLALAHLVNLSFAQNLFYLALLLAPAPLPRENDDEPSQSIYVRTRNFIFPPKPMNWCPHPALQLLCLTQSYGVLFVTPMLAGIDSFSRLLVVGRALTFAPLLISAAAPVSWGKVYAHPHDADSTVTEIFRFVSMASFLLQAKALTLALLYNAPDARYHRHSKFLPFDLEQRSALERTTTALSKILGSTSDHPAVAAAARDVLLSTVSVTVWAAVRPLDISDILACATPFFKSKALEKFDGFSGQNDSPGSDVLEAPGPAASTRRKTRSARAVKDEILEAEDGTSTRRRRRARRTADPDEESDDEYLPTPTQSVTTKEGDVMPNDDELDWEAAAVTWGLTVIGGLGFGSAGAFGAQCVSR